MKKMIGKMMALGLAGAMVLGMSMTAFVDGPTLQDLTVPVTKTVYFFNDKGGDVYEPNVTYTYTLSVPTEAQLNDATVTDYDGTQGTVKAGTAEAIKTGNFTLAYKSSNAKVTVDKQYGAAVTKANNFVIDPTGFKFNDEGAVDKANGVLCAGIYRYIITETVSAVGSSTDVQASGLTAREGYTTTRILDIYIDNDGNTTPVILNDPSTTSTSVTGGTDPSYSDDNPEKTEGFGDEGAPGDTETDTEGQPSKTETGTSTNSFAGKASDGTNDRYTTYNMTVQKTVAGAMGDKSNKFPFQVDIAKSIETNKFDYKFANGDLTPVTLGTDGVATIGSATSSGSVTLKDGEKIELIGVPTKQGTSNDATAVINEFNNTKDTYTVSGTEYTVTTTTLAKNTASANTGTVNITAEKDVVITNTLDEISPTGVTLRFAPYMMMLGAAFFLVAVSRRRRVED